VEGKARLGERRVAAVVRFELLPLDLELGLEHLTSNPLDSVENRTAPIKNEHAPASGISDQQSSVLGALDAFLVNALENRGCQLLDRAFIGELGRVPLSRKLASILEVCSNDRQRPRTHRFSHS